MALTVPARAEHIPTLRTAARGFAEHHGVPEPDDVALAITEAATNVVRYAYPEGSGPIPIHFAATRTPTTVVFVVTDHGCGLSAPRTGPSLGLGLELMMQLAQHVAISTRAGGGTTVQLTFAARAVERVP